MERINSFKSRVNKNKKLSLDLSIRDEPSCSKIKAENVDENSNFTETMEQCTTPGSTCSGITPLLPEIKNLNLESCTEASALYHPFGKVENVIATMGLALIQSTSTIVLVDIDTPVFIVLPSVSHEDEAKPEYILLGEVDDIFGSIGKPMYSVRLSRAILEKSRLMINSFVYLSSSHPNTNILRVENTGEKYYVVAEENSFYDE